MVNKTKAELLEELESKKDEIKQLKKDIERSKNQEQFNEAARLFWDMRCSLVDVGFSEKTAERFVIDSVVSVLQKQEVPE